MSFPRRDLTEKLLEAIDEGLIDRDAVIMACVKFMTEEQVKAMCKANDFLVELPEENDPLDDFNYVGSRYHY